MASELVQGRLVLLQRQVEKQGLGRRGVPVSCYQSQASNLKGAASDISEKVTPIRKF